MAISRMQQPRQLYGIGRLVKKATRGIKKVVKSPIGKAALLAGGAYLLGGAGSLGGGGIFTKGQGLTRFSNLANLFKPSYRNLATKAVSRLGRSGAPGGGDPDMYSDPRARKKGILSGLFFNKDNKFDLGRTAISSLGIAGVAAPFLMGGDEDEEGGSSLGPGMDVEAVRQQARDYYKNPMGSSLAFMPDKQYIRPEYYMASGGRVNFQMGGGAAQEQAEQMLMMEYVKYKNKGGQLSFQEFVEAVMAAQAEQQGMEQGMQQTMDPGMEQPMDPGMEQPMDPGMQQTMDMPVGAAYGGRIDYANGGYDNTGIMQMASMPDMNDERNSESLRLFNKPIYELSPEELDLLEEFLQNATPAVGAAYGGRIGYADGTSFQRQTLEKKGYSDTMQNMTPKEISELYDSVMGTFSRRFAEGGRIGFKDAGMVNDNYSVEDYEKDQQKINEFMYQEQLEREFKEEMRRKRISDQRNLVAYGGRIGRAEGGLMNLGGMEKDYRAEGGFVPLGGEEKADDVPARLSKNEFVFTADAVRNAGGGDIDRGAEVMENMMNNLEAGGRISQESQGSEGAQEMYNQQQMLQSRMI